jgi:hypothetical protein
MDTSPPPPSENPCAGQPDGTACGDRGLCSRQVCVVGMGTCAGGELTCNGTSCNTSAGSDCTCVQSLEHGTRCARVFRQGTVPGFLCDCDSDSDCRTRSTPLGPDAFCAVFGASACYNCTGVSGGICVLPCPT